LNRTSSLCRVQGVAARPRSSENLRVELGMQLLNRHCCHWRIPLIAFVCASSASGLGLSQCKDQGNETTKSCKILIVPDTSSSAKKVMAKPDFAKIKHGLHIRWVTGSGLHQFTITFKNCTPFSSNQYNDGKPETDNARDEPSLDCYYKVEVPGYPALDPHIIVVSSPPLTAAPTISPSKEAKPPQ